jgi:hypothetical protein
MVRTLSITVALTALVGFGLGWLAFSGPGTKPRGAGPAKDNVTAPRDAPRPRAASGSPAERPRTAAESTSTAVVQRFALQPADVTADRETPAVAVAPDGTVVMAWASQAEANASVRTLYLARTGDGGTTFETPVAWRSVPIYRFTSGGGGGSGARPSTSGASGEKEGGRKMSFSTHVLPRLTATPAGLALGWVEAIDGGSTVRYLVARSNDGGKSFSEPVAVHGADASRPGFTTLTADADGGLACGWLDGRDQGQRPFWSAWPADSDGFGPEQLVYDGPDGNGICPCCDVAVATTGRTTFVAFRNSDAGHRDIWIARGGNESGGARTGNQGRAFAAPIPVTPDAWTFNGCPHDGPSLALAGENLAVAWMDAHTGTSRVYFAVAPAHEDGAGLRFHPRPLAPQGRGSQGHPRLVADRGGTLHAAWDEGLAPEAPATEKSAGGEAGGHHHPSPTTGGGGAGRAVVYAVSRDGGASFTPGRAIAPSPGVYQVQPTLTLGPDGTVFVAWNEVDQEGKHAVFARLWHPASTSAARAGTSEEPRTP